MHRLSKGAGIVMAAAFLVAGSDARAELFSKAYAFKPGTTLDVGAEMPGGLRLDSVQFVLQKDPNDGGTFTGPKVKVKDRAARSTSPYPCLPRQGSNYSIALRQLRCPRDFCRTFSSANYANLH